MWRSLFCCCYFPEKELEWKIEEGEKRIKNFQVERNLSIVKEEEEIGIEIEDKSNEINKDNIIESEEVIIISN